MPPIIHIDEIDSTNSYLKKLLINQELEEGTIVSAQYQTTGRGQKGNSWESDKGKNLTFSMVLYPTFVPIVEQFILSQIASLAVKEVLEKYTDNITIKWSNDVYSDEKKICGMLIENILLDDKIANCIIGIGLNINQEIFLSDAPNPISLKQITKQEHNLENILTSIQNKILFHYQELKLGKKQIIIESYKRSLFRKEGYHKYHDGEKYFEARIKDILPTGHLILKTKDGEDRVFAFKEVRYILD